MLEATQHGDNAFVTLTYDDEHLPADGSLKPTDTTNFLKRLRKTLPYKIRFYLVGEYGDQSWRPHYHAIVFGMDTCARGGSVYSLGRSSCCARCDSIREIWGKGHILCGSADREAIQYVCGYVAKKLTNKDDPRLAGRHPEYSRQSRQNGGLGLGFMHEVASTFLSFDLETREADVPVSLSHGRSPMPLGRYLRRKLRTMVGKDEKPPENVRNPLQEKMQNLLQASISTKKVGSYWSLKEEIKALGANRAMSLEAKSRIHKKRGNQ